MAASARTLLDRLGDSRSAWFGVGSSAALAALAFVEPRGLTGGGRLLYRGAIGAIGAWTTWASLRTERARPGSDLSADAPGTGAALAGVAVAAAAPLGERLDARFVDALVRRGVARPRIPLAVLNATLSLGAWYLDRRLSARDDDGAAASIAATEAAAAEAPLRSKIVVSAVVLRNEAGEVLTVRKRGTQRFMFPGGKPEPGETTAQTAIRETREELGVELDAAQLVHLGDFETDAANEPGHTVVASVFAHPGVAGAVASGEIEELAWVAPDADRDDLAPLLRDAVFPALREH